MRIAVASGKGGTGKTTIATSLASSLVGQWARDTYSGSIAPLFLDCDVEAPNAHLFLKPTFNGRRVVANQIPQVDESLCTFCGKCAEACAYHAIAVLGQKTLVFSQLCHGCGSCTLICPEAAIAETPAEMGVLEHGITAEGIEFARGILNIGEPMAVPVIRQLKKWVFPKEDQVVILDSPPGASCPVVETVRGADFLLLVTEPTPFGLHDLKLAVGLARVLAVPAGVVINRDGIGDARVEEFCRAEGLPVLLRIPFDKSIAEGIAQGKTLAEIDPETVSLFQQLFIRITAIVEAEVHIKSVGLN